MRILALVCCIAALLLVPSCDKGSGGDNAAETPKESELDRTKRKTAEVEMQQIGDAVDLFVVSEGRTPASMESLTAPATGAPYLDGIQEDPWGTPYVLEMEGKSGRAISAGPDMEIGTDDDISVSVGSP